MNLKKGGIIPALMRCREVYDAPAAQIVFVICR